MLSRLKNISIVLLIVLFQLGCGQQHTVGNELPTVNKKSDLESLLEGDNKKEIAFLLYNMALNKKELILYFHGNYREGKIERVELLQDDRVVSTNVHARSVYIENNGVLPISITSYIDKFNQVRLFTDNNEEFTLEVGQYLFEKIDLKKTIPENNRWVIDQYVAEEVDNKFMFDSSFSKLQKSEDVIEAIVSNTLINADILSHKIDKVLDEDTENLELSYSSEISMDYFVDNDFVNVGYDLVLLQKNLNREQYAIIELFIPLQKTSNQIKPVSN